MCESRDRVGLLVVLSFAGGHTNGESMQPINWVPKWYSILVIWFHYFTILPAFPTCSISPVLASSLLNVGQEAPSAFTRFSSNFEPKTVNFEAAGSISPNNGTTALYRLGGSSVVIRSRVTDVGEENSILAVFLLIFFKKYEAITAVGV